MQGIWQVFRKEFIQCFRDRQLRGLIIAPPLANIFLFAYAFTTDVNRVATGILDRDNSAASRDLVQRFAGSGYFDIVARVADEPGMRDLIDRGAASAVLRIDAGFEDSLRGGRTASAQMILDGSDSTTAGVVLNYAGNISQRYSEENLRSRYQQLLGPFRAPGVTVQTRARLNENLDSRNYYLPGVMATTIFLATLTLTGLGIVREREMGTIEQIMVSPITPLEFIIGKTAPFACIGLVNLAAMMALGVFLFDVPVRGNLLWIFLPALPYLGTAIGLGMLVSTFSKTQQEAMISVFFIYFLLIFFSGFIYPISGMPEIVQAITQINPLRHFLIIVRGVLIKGIGPAIIWPQILALVLFAVVTIGFAARRFRKTYT